MFSASRIGCSFFSRSLFAEYVLPFRLQNNNPVSFCRQLLARLSFSRDSSSCDNLKATTGVSRTAQSFVLREEARGDSRELIQIIEN